MKEASYLIDYGDLLARQGQKPALPRCNSNGWFTSISRHSGVEMPCS
jgi:hypothetical protein